MPVTFAIGPPFDSNFRGSKYSTQPDPLGRSSTVSARGSAIGHDAGVMVRAREHAVVRTRTSTFLARLGYLNAHRLTGRSPVSACRADRVRTLARGGPFALS